MDGKTLARIGAVIFVALAITATAIEMNRPADRQADPGPLAPPAVTRDPLRAELARCGAMGEAGGHDPSCLRTWAENRRRFLGQPASALPPASNAPATLFPSASPSAEPAGTTIPAPDQNRGR